MHCNYKVMLLIQGWLISKRNYFRLKFGRLFQKEIEKKKKNWPGHLQEIYFVSEAKFIPLTEKPCEV